MKVFTKYWSSIYINSNIDKICDFQTCQLGLHSRPAACQQTNTSL
jgi:hypothetical protein